MIYTTMIKKAMKIAYEAHKDQVDKGGMPYIFHSFHVAEQMKDEECIIVAFLHDVIEDSEWTLDRLKEEGFSDIVIQALSYLTHDEGVPYMDYIEKVSEHPIAALVKLADLKHNSNLSRLTAVTEEDEKRLRKYEEAFRYLRRVGFPYEYKKREKRARYFLFELANAVVKFEDYSCYWRDRKNHTWEYDMCWEDRFYDCAYDVIQIDYDEEKELIYNRRKIPGFGCGDDILFPNYRLDND